MSPARKRTNRRARFKRAKIKTGRKLTRLAAFRDRLKLLGKGRAVADLLNPE